MAQGPLQNTTNDFWKMCWQSCTPVIVMLTTVNCDHYWPKDCYPTSYNDIVVTVTQEVRHADWIIRNFHVKKVC